MNTIDWYLRSQLKLRHLQMVIAIDDLRHVGKVANYLHVSQPAVSKTLSELENNIGLKLFHRTTHGMSPTIYGNCLVIYAKKILAELGKVRDELCALVSGLEGKISVGALPGAAVVILPKAIVQLKQQSPNAGIVVTEGSMETLKPKLLSGEVDIIVGMLPDDARQTYMEEIILYREKMVLVAGRHYRQTKAPPISWQTLQDALCVLPPHGSITREPIEQEFHRRQLSLPVNYIESISTMVTVGILQHSMALAFLPEAVACYYAEIGLLTILPLSVPQLVQPTGVLYMKSQPLSPATQLFIEILRQKDISLIQDSN